MSLRKFVVALVAATAAYLALSVFVANQARAESLVEMAPAAVFEPASGFA